MSAAAWAWSAAACLGGWMAVLRIHYHQLDALPEHGAEAPSPSVCLCIPARDEVREVGRALDSWLAQDYGALRILVVDDGSTDGTAEALAVRAEARPERLRVLRNERLPAGWLGKNHALDLASRQPEALEAEWLLFADADVQAAPDLLRRAFAYLAERPADVLALLPAIDAETRGERLMLPMAAAGFLSLVWPRQVADPRRKWAFCGVGAFTLVRRAAYDGIGGHAAAPLEAIDDMMLARRAKVAGFTNRVARGGPALHLRMYHGLGDIVRAMRKNAAALPGAWLLAPVLHLAAAALFLCPLWLPFAGYPGLALFLWLMVPALAGDVDQRFSGRPMDPIWMLWPLVGPLFAAGGLWAFSDRVRGFNHWRGRSVRLG